MLTKTKEECERILTLMAKDIQGIMDKKFKESVDAFYNSPNPYNNGARGPKYYKRGYNFYSLSKGAVIRNASNQYDMARTITLTLDTANMRADYRGRYDPETGQDYGSVQHISSDTIFELDFVEGYHGGRKIFFYDRTRWGLAGKRLKAQASKSATRTNKWRDTVPSYQLLMGPYGSLNRALGDKHLDAMWDKYEKHIDRAIEEDIDRALEGR